MIGFPYPRKILAPVNHERVGWPWKSEELSRAAPDENSAISTPCNLAENNSL